MGGDGQGEKPLVRFDVEDGVGVISIDNPPVNALAPGVRDGIVEAVEKGEADPKVVAMVMIGAGRSFIAGADIRQFGKGAKQRAIVEMWNRRVEMELLARVAAAFRHLHPAAAQLEVPQVAAWGEANKPKAQEVLRLLDQELGKRRFIAGDEYSVADITALVAVDFTKPARVERPQGLDNLARWHQEVSARPSAKA